MKYEKCPICEEKLRNGVCPMCGYDFNRLGRSRILKDGHWDILTTDKKTSQPKYIHDEKRHPDFKNIKNTKTQSMKTQRKISTYKNKKEKKKMCIRDRSIMGSGSNGQLIMDDKIYLRRQPRLG